jgi:hypothetical protein
LSWINWRREIIAGIIIVLAVAPGRLRHRRASAAQEWGYGGDRRESHHGDV